MTRAAAGFPLRSKEPKCANTRGIKEEEGSPARRTARRGDIVMSWWEVFWKVHVCDGISTESELAAMRLTKTLSPRGSCSGDVVPIRLLRVGAEGFGSMGPDGIRRTFWEVDGRASRAGLTECALRLCVCVERGTICAWREGVTTMRRAWSLRRFSDIVPLKAETDDSSTPPCWGSSKDVFFFSVPLL
jgi:hypothetical protein